MLLGRVGCAHRATMAVLPEALEGANILVNKRTAGIHRSPNPHAFWLPAISELFDTAPNTFLLNSVKSTKDLDACFSKLDPSLL